METRYTYPLKKQYMLTNITTIKYVLEYYHLHKVYIRPETVTEYAYLFLGKIRRTPCLLITREHFYKDEPEHLPEVIVLLSK